MNNAGLKVSTPSDTTIALTRTFNAPRRMVWEAMTDPAKLRGWMFAPPGWEMTVCEFDARLGGAYRWVWKNEHANPVMTIRGVMTEVVPQSRVVHTQVMEMAQCEAVGEFIVMLELSELGGLTHMKMTLKFASKQERDNALKWGMEHGMEIGYKTMEASFAA